MEEGNARGAAEWGQVIQYEGGRAWGITPELATICMGSEASIKATILDPRQRIDNIQITGIINLERELIKKELEGYGRRVIGKANSRASKPDRIRNKRVRSGNRTRRFRINH